MLFEGVEPEPERLPSSSPSINVVLMCSNVVSDPKARTLLGEIGVGTAVLPAVLFLPGPDRHVRFARLGTVNDGLILVSL